MDRRQTVRLGRPRVVQDDEVFQAMTNMVIRVGLPRLSVNELAVDLGISPAALRQRFGSKAELIRAFHSWGTEQMRVILEAAEQTGDTPLEALNAVVRASVPSMDSPARVINALSMLTDPAADDSARTQIADRLRIAVEYTARLIGRAVAAGELDHPDPAGLATRLQETLIGACVVWALQQDPSDGSLAERILAATDAVLAPFRSERGTRRTTS